MSTAETQAPDGYLASPAQVRGEVPDPPWPGVVVVHDAFGMTPDLRRQADKLAAAGYLALAPDLWRGRPWLMCIRPAFRQLMAGSGPIFSDLAAAATQLAGMDACTGKIGVIGFCLGGGFALMCAPREDFAVASVNYGPVPKEAEQVLAGSCPVVASYGARDRGMARQVSRLRDAMTRNDVPADIKVYPGAGHAFLNRYAGARGALMKVTGMSYQPDAAADAWERILAFFGEHLRG